MNDWDRWQQPGMVEDYRTFLKKFGIPIAIGALTIAVFVWGIVVAF
jgi:hypothetical protein